MVDAHRRYADNSTVDAETFVSVKNLLKEFGEKVVTTTNDNDRTFVSVRQRLRKFDTRQDDDDGHCDNNDDDAFTKVSDRIQQNNNRASLSSVRDSIGSVTTPGKSSKAVFSPIAASSPQNTPLSSSANRTIPRRTFVPRSSPITKSLVLGNNSSATNNMTDSAPKSLVMPLTVALFHSEADNDQSSHTNQSSSSLKENSATKEGFKYGDVMLKKVKKSGEDGWKRSTPNGSSTERAAKAAVAVAKAAAATAIAADTQPLTKSERSTQQKDPDQHKINSSPLPKSSSHKKKPVPAKKPQPLDHRNKSLPISAGTKQDLSSQSVHDETYQKDIGAVLKKVGRPADDRWKSIKKAEEEDVSDTSKPLFATMKLRSVGTPTNHPTNPKAAFAERLKCFDGQTTPSGLNQNNFQLDNDDKKSTLPKRNRKSATSVSNLRKSFSPQVKLASRGEREEEEKVTGRAPSSAVNEITQIKSSLKSTAKELEDLRKSINSSTSTPVSKLIAERNKAAKANRSGEHTRKKMGSPEVVLARATTRRRSKSFSSSHPSNAHRRRKSMSSTHTAEDSTTDGRSSVKMPPSPSCKRGRDRKPVRVERNSVRVESGIPLEGDCAVGFLNSWKDFKANNNTAVQNGGEIWNMNLDDSPFFGEMSSSKSCTALDKYDDDISGTNDELLPSNSTISEYTTDSSEGDYYYDHRRFLQITLSSGGITEIFEPAVAMSPTEESSMSDGTSMAYVTDSSDSRRDRRMGLVPLMGAKKFFFGKNKKKSGPIEV